MEEPIKYVYAIIYETDICGVWTDPKKAIKYAFRYELEIEGGIRLENEGRLLTAKEATKRMLKSNCNYPYLAKIKINPTNNNEVWELDR